MNAVAYIAGYVAPGLSNPKLPEITYSDPDDDFEQD